MSGAKLNLSPNGLPNITQIKDYTSANPVTAVNGAVSNVTGKVTTTINKAQSVATGAINTANQTANTVKQTASAIQQFANGISASSILNVSPDIAKQAYAKTSGLFKDVNLTRNTNVGNLTNSITNGIKESTSAIQSVTNSFTGGIQNLATETVSFIASTTDKMVDGVILPVLQDITAFTNFTGAQIGKLAALGNEALKSVTSGFSAIANSVGTLYTAGTNAVNTVINGTIGAANAIVNPILQPLKDLAQTVYTVTDPRFANALVQSNLSFLPPELRNALAYKASQGVASLTGNFNQKLGNILNKTYALESLLGSGSISSLLGNVTGTPNGLGGYGTGLPAITSPDGSYLYGQSEFNGSYQQYNALINAIKTLCGDSNIESTFGNYSDDVDIFDILLDVLLNSGAGKLLETLLNCGPDNQGKDYFTGRSANIIRSKIGNVAASGNVYTYKTLVNYGGADVTVNPKMEVLSLYGTATYSEEIKEDLKEIMVALSMKKSDVLSGGKIGDANIVDAAKATFVQNGDQRLQQELLTDTEYAAINAALAMYGTPAIA